MTILMVVIGAIGYNTYEKNGFPKRNKYLEQNLTQFSHQEKFYSNKYARDSYPEFDGFYAYKSNEHEPTIIFLGDSFANRLIMGMEEVNKDEVYLQLSNHSCPEFLDLSTPVSKENLETDKCALYAEYAINVAVKSKSIKSIVIYYRGPHYISENPGREIYYQKDIAKNNSAALEKSIRKTFERLSSSGKNIIFIYSNPELTFEPKMCVDTRPFRFEP
jgi:hypothetical protein